MRFVKPFLAGLLALYVLAWAYRIYTRKYHIWLPDYLRRSVVSGKPVPPPVHIFFFISDHFEPSVHFERMQRWVDEYPKLADRHRDSGGRPLQRTWFYPADDPVDENMEALRKLTAAGYGEVELHLHHLNDTQETTERRFREGIEYFQKFGFLKTIDGQTRFGFAHGNGGLDNSRGAAFCGANRELALLRDLGCYADFSFPAIWQESQPSLVNVIFEATDDDGPKSYDRGRPLELGRPPSGDLVIFPGPLRMAPVARPQKLFVEIEDSDIHPAVPATEARVDRWVGANIHVAGRPDWVFVKIHGHGASSDDDIDEALGANFDRALTYLETRYNDGDRYVLHYVTAREAFNLARAAADGCRGDPNQYLNWVVRPYLAGKMPHLQALR